jgi:hypothetical protein
MAETQDLVFLFDVDNTLLHQPLGPRGARPGARGDARPAWYRHQTAGVQGVSRRA